MHKYLLILLASTATFAQEIYVRSIFQRPGPDGEVVKVDRMESAGREILSPPAIRDGFTSFHVTIAGTPGTPYTLYMGLNPEDAVTVTLYREIHQPDGIPHLLEEAKLPIAAAIPESGAVNFWLDIWVAAKAPVRRIKVEPQVWIPDRWIIYPMEVRIVQPVVPKFELAPTQLPGSALRADRVVYPLLRETLCNTPPGKVDAVPAPTVFSLMHRNIAQDMALAKAKPREEAVAGILSATGIANLEDWCSVTTVSQVGELPAEWFLRVRDFLYRVAVN